MNTVTRIHYSECIDKKAINPAYAQLIVLRKFKVILLRICLAVCLIFAGYVVFSFVLVFVCVFLGFIFKYVEIFMKPEQRNAYKRKIIASM